MKKEVIEYLRKLDENIQDVSAKAIKDITLDAFSPNYQDTVLNRMESEALRKNETIENVISLIEDYGEENYD